MSHPASFSVLVWDSTRPERPARSRPNTRASNLFPRVYLPQPTPYPNPASTSSSSVSYSPSSSAFSHSHATSYSPMNSPPTSPQLSLIKELEGFSTCEISDAFIKLGLTHNAKEVPVQRGGFLPDIQMLSPSPHDIIGQNKRICGRAYTVK
jgi:hypothetical protein